MLWQCRYWASKFLANAQDFWRIGCACRHRRSLNLAGSGEGSRAGIGSHSVGSEGSWNVSITTVAILLLAILVAPVLLIRFRKRWVAAFNLAVTNRITSRFAARLPGFGILTHVGRKSGRIYGTPVNVFRAHYVSLADKVLKRREQ